MLRSIPPNALFFCLCANSDVNKCLKALGGKAPGTNPLEAVNRLAPLPLVFDEILVRHILMAH
jgi:hypothetical protein